MTEDIVEYKISNSKMRLYSLKLLLKDFFTKKSAAEGFSDSFLKSNIWSRLPKSC